jgi:TonB family protein
MTSHDAPSLRRKKRRDAGPGRVLAALLLAVLGHGLFLGLLVLHHEVFPPLPPKPRPEEVSLRPIDAAQWAQNRGEDRASPSGTNRVPPKRPEPKVEPKTKEDEVEGQVVATAPGNNQTPEEAKRLAETNNRVEKETRAREQDPNYRNAAPKRTSPRPTPGSSEARELVAQGNGGRGDDDRPVRDGARAILELPDTQRRDEIALKADPTQPGPGTPVDNQRESEPMPGNAKRLRIQQGEGTSAESGDTSRGRAGAKGLAALMPSAESMDRIIGSAPNDNLRDVDEGDTTALNSKYFKHAGFFNRIGRAIGTYWRPQVALQRRDPTGEIYGDKIYETVLKIRIDTRGNLLDVRVVDSSGLTFLDSEVVEAVEKAQPFPNPPTALADANGNIEFFGSWTMDTTRPSLFRFFR